VYQIPYRCFITPDIDNLFVAGRLISASHVAFGSTRVMATSAAGGEVVGTAAAICHNQKLLPVQLSEPKRISLLQAELIRSGNYIPRSEVSIEKSLVHDASISVSSELKLHEIPFEGGIWKRVNQSIAQMLPVNKGKFPELAIQLNVLQNTTVKFELRISSEAFNHTPDITLDYLEMDLNEGVQDLKLKFNTELPYNCYAFVCVMKNEQVDLLFSVHRITGILTVFNKVVPAVSNFGKQVVTEDIGIEEFEFWCPERRPEGHNLAMKINPPIAVFGAENLLTLVNRPVEKPNAWVADLNDHNVEINLRWEEPKTIHQIVLQLDTDWDHPMESVQWGHHDDRMPFCVDHIRVFDQDNFLLVSKDDNHQTRVQLSVNNDIKVSSLRIVLSNSSENVPVAVFSLLIY